MFEKYTERSDQWGYYIDEDGIGEIAFFKAGWGGNSKDRAERLYAKLNRLAALEAVCGEIVESAPEDLNEAENACDFRAGELDAMFGIAQKLKGVLEEK